MKSLQDPIAIQHMAMHVMFRRDLNELKVSKAERPNVRPRVGLSAFAYIYMCVINTISVTYIYIYIPLCIYEHIIWNIMVYHDGCILGICMTYHTTTMLRYKITCGARFFIAMAIFGDLLSG